MEYHDESGFNIASAIGVSSSDPGWSALYLTGKGRGTGQMIESWKANLYRIIDRALYTSSSHACSSRTHAWNGKISRFK